jgi:hypothetical protein
MLKNKFIIFFDRLKNILIYAKPTQGTIVINTFGTIVLLIKDQNHLVVFIWF